jgi:hypothetical protein
MILNRRLLLKSAVFFLVCGIVVLMLLFFSNNQMQNETNFNVGDYVEFGKYNSSLILWRVIHKDEFGNPILLSDQILTLKAFDSAGSYHMDEERREIGSNDYENSNVRQWLNSTDQSIQWKQNKPIASNTQGNNPYTIERGFLADDNFTSNERKIIRTFKHKVLLSNIDKPKADGGSVIHSYDVMLGTTSGKVEMDDVEIVNALTNYDEAFYKNINDRVFLLSVEQLKEWVYDQRDVLGEKWYIGSPTGKAIKTSTLQSDDMKEKGEWNYWLNTPVADSNGLVRYVSAEGTVFHTFANHSLLGVRPALQIDSSLLNISGDGVGTNVSPYRVVSQ